MSHPSSGLRPVVDTSYMLLPKLVYVVFGHVTLKVLVSVSFENAVSNFSARCNDFAMVEMQAIVDFFHDDIW